jgi:hypothetical protein
MCSRQLRLVPLADPGRFIQLSRRAATLNPLVTHLPSNEESQAPASIDALIMFCRTNL